MTDPQLILDQLLAKLKDIPALVAQLGSADQIVVYRDLYPNQISLARMLADLGPSQLLLLWLGADAADLGNMEIWRHRFSLLLRLPVESSGAVSAAYKIWQLAWNGAAGTGDTFRRQVYTPPGSVIEAPISIGRRPLVVGPDAMIDYFECSFTMRDPG